MVIFFSYAGTWRRSVGCRRIGACRYLMVVGHRLMRTCLPTMVGRRRKTCRFLMLIGRRTPTIRLVVPAGIRLLRRR
jgi:hypothetical protein